MTTKNLSDEKLKIFAVIAHGHRMADPRDVARALKPVFTAIKNRRRKRISLYFSYSEKMKAIDPSLTAKELKNEQLKILFTHKRDIDPVEMEVSALSQAVILVVSHIIKSWCENAMISLDAHAIGHRINKISLQKVGPVAGLVPWADAVIAASNCIRHREEWIKLATKTRSASVWNNESVEIFLSSLTTKSHGHLKQNIKTILGMGIEPGHLFNKDRKIEFELVEKLGIGSAKTTLLYLRDYQRNLAGLVSENITGYRLPLQTQDSFVKGILRKRRKNRVKK